MTFNGQPVKRSPAGHFAPSFPLQVGVNNFSVRYQGQAIQIAVIRTANQPVLPAGLGFAPDSLLPAVDIAKWRGNPFVLAL